MEDRISHISWSWEAGYFIFSLMEDILSHNSWSLEAGYLISSFYGRQNISYFLVMGGRIFDIFILWKTEYLIFPGHGRQDI